MINKTNAEYDAIVIGSGIGGMAAAIRLCQRDKRVLLLEASDRFGGYSRPVVFGGYKFDLGIHYLGKLGPGEEFRRLLDELGLEELEFIELDPDGFDTYIFPDYEFKFPKGRERLAARLIRDFPREEKGIQAYLDTIERVDEATTPSAMAKGGLLNWAAFLLKHPIILRHSRVSYQTFLDSIIDDQRLKAVLSAPLFDVAVGPVDGSSAVVMSAWTYYLNGAYFPKGGSEGLCEAFVKRSIELGANLVPSSLVTNMTRKNDLWIVKTEGGEEYTGRVVVSNADPKTTICSLVARELVPNSAYRKAAALVPSGSVCAAYVGTDINLTEMGFTNGNVAQFADWNVQAVYDSWLGDSDPMVKGLSFINSPTVRDPGADLAPEGHHTLQVFMGGSYRAFKKLAASSSDEEISQFKKEIGDQLVRQAEQQIKGLSDHITMIECVTPLEVEGRVKAVEGGIYGPAHIPSQMGLGRFPSMQCGVEGLFLAGAGTLGGGLLNSAASGYYAAEKSLDYLRE